MNDFVAHLMSLQKKNHKKMTICFESHTWWTSSLEMFWTESPLKKNLDLLSFSEAGVDAKFSLCLKQCKCNTRLHAPIYVTNLDCWTRLRFVVSMFFFIGHIRFFFKLLTLNNLLNLQNEDDTISANWSWYMIFFNIFSRNMCRAKGVEIGHCIQLIVKCITG